MRNSKVKGFTLVELIVVIAIIAILAAILVPNMLGYIKDSRYSQADANAKNVHTAATAAIAKLYADGKIGDADAAGNGGGGNGGGNGQGTEQTSPVIKKGSMTVAVSIGRSASIDLENGLGTEFKGAATFKYNDATGAVTAAAWTANENGTPAYTRNKKTDSVIYGIFPTPEEVSASNPASGQGGSDD